MTTNVLLVGATGMLGSTIANHLIDHPDTSVRLLVREPSPGDADTAAALDDLVSRGAQVVTGDVTVPQSLDAATNGMDVVISALQGQSDIMVDGQIALAESAVRSGVGRFFPSDYAIDLFAAPDGAPQFDVRKQAAKAIDAMPMQVVHVLNGGFMDMMLDPSSPAIVDPNTNTANVFGTGDERFDLTTVDDTARFVTLLATDPSDVSGVRKVSGSQTSFNEVIAGIEEASGQSITSNTVGGADDLRAMISGADDPWDVMMQWYLLSMITVPAFADTDNDRYDGFSPTTLQQYLTATRTPASGS